VALEKSKLSLQDVADMAQSGPVILTRNGKPLAAVKDMSGSDWEAVALANNPKFIALIEKSRRAHQEEGGIAIEELRRELGLKARPAQKRRKRRQ
jgi:hypothetical protein